MLLGAHLLLASEAISGPSKGRADVTLGEAADIIVCRGDILEKGLVKYIVIIRKERGTYQKPFWLDCSDSTDIVLGCENEFIIQHPLGLVSQDGGRVQEHILVVLDGKVLALAACVLLRDLHEETRAKSTADVLVVLLVLEVSGHHLQILAFHDAEQLRADVISGLESPLGEEVVVAPLLRVCLSVTASVCVVDVQHCQVVSIGVCKEVLHLVCTLALGSRTNEDLRHR